MASPEPAPRAADAARRGPPRPEERGGGQGAAAMVKEEAEEVKIRALVMVKEELELEEVEVRAVDWVGESGKRRRVKREREVVAAEARPSGRGAGRQQAGNAGRGASRFRGVTKAHGGKGAKPWKAKIQVSKGGKLRQIHIANFAQEEDAARAFDRVSIAELGHTQARTNFPVAEYQEEWAQLEALGVDTAVAREKQRAKRLEA